MDFCQPNSSPKAHVYFAARLAVPSVGTQACLAAGRGAGSWVSQSLQKQALSAGSPSLGQSVSECTEGELVRQPVTGRKQKTFLLRIKILRAGVAFGPNYPDKHSCRQIRFSCSPCLCGVGIRREWRQFPLHDANVSWTAGLKGNSTQLTSESGL